MHAAVQDAGKKQVAAILGVQAARAATQPRPFLKLARQHLAVQARCHSAYMDVPREENTH